MGESGTGCPCAHKCCFCPWASGIGVWRTRTTAHAGGSAQPPPLPTRSPHFVGPTCGADEVEPQLKGPKAKSGSGSRWGPSRLFLSGHHRCGWGGILTAGRRGLPSPPPPPPQGGWGLARHVSPVGDQVQVLVQHPGGGGGCGQWPTNVWKLQLPRHHMRYTRFLSWTLWKPVQHHTLPYPVNLGYFGGNAEVCAFKR